MFKLIRLIYLLCFVTGLIGIPFLTGTGRSFANIDYLRTLNRTASLGTIDSIFFNPSGTTRLADGIYLYFGVPVANNFGDAQHFGHILPSLAFVHKEFDKSIFFSIAPLPNTKVILLNSKTTSPDVLGDYDINHITYEFSLGGGFSVKDSAMFSVAAKIQGSIDADKIQYYKGKNGKKSPRENSLKESYFLSRFDTGFRLHLGFSYQPMSWLSLSLNFDTPGIGISRYVMAQFIISPAAESKQSNLEGRPQKQGVSENILVILPLHFDLGLRFSTFASDFMILQVTGYAEVFNNKNRLPGSKEKLFQPAGILKNISYGGGVGMDLKIVKNVTLGFGTHFDQMVSRDTHYKSVADSISQIKWTSLSFSTGLQIEIQPLFDFSFSFVYPLYLSFKKGVQISRFKEPHTNGNVSVGGMELGLGFNFKFYGL